MKLFTLSIWCASWYTFPDRTGLGHQFCSRRSKNELLWKTLNLDKMFACLYDVDSFGSILDCVSENLAFCLKLEYDTNDACRSLLQVEDAQFWEVPKSKKDQGYFASIFEIFERILNFSSNRRRSDYWCSRLMRGYIEPLLETGIPSLQMLQEVLMTRVLLNENIIQELNVSVESRGIVFVLTRRIARLIASVMNKSSSLEMMIPTKFVGQHYFEGISWEHEQNSIRLNSDKVKFVYWWPQMFWKRIFKYQTAILSYAALFHEPNARL